MTVTLTLITVLTCWVDGAADVSGCAGAAALPRKIIINTRRMAFSQEDMNRNASRSGSQ